jgi:predicted ABC-type transport system involved in lysophospholipase L1 biosynthesis ATPase subunit
MALLAGGLGIQLGCVKLRLVEDLEGSAAKVLSVLLEVRAGCCRRNGAGEVLESELHGVGQDDSFVLTGERMGEVWQALKLVVDLPHAG